MPSLGRFLTRDVWDGNTLRPMSHNQWMYGYGNPINQIDPSGHDSYCDSPYADPEECDFEPPEDGIPGCGEICMNEATKPLKTWGELYTFTNPERALSIRLLLAEIGWRIVANSNWQDEGSGILWTVRNRMIWEVDLEAGDVTKYSHFYTCDMGFTTCALRQGQYATTTTTRGRDPLYLDPDEPGRRRSYYHDTKYIPIAIERAFLVATKFLYGSAPDPTNTDGRGGAHFFSHKPAPNTHFSRQVDVFCKNKYIFSYLKSTLELPYVENNPDTSFSGCLHPRILCRELSIINDVVISQLRCGDIKESRCILSNI